MAITVFNIFGDTVRGQVGDMAAELGGGTAVGSGQTAGGLGATEGAKTTEYGLQEFKQAE